MESPLDVLTRAATMIEANQLNQINGKIFSQSNVANSIALTLIWGQDMFIVKFKISQCAMSDKSKYLSTVARARPCYVYLFVCILLNYHDAYSFVAIH